MKQAYTVHVYKNINKGLLIQNYNNMNEKDISVVNKLMNFYTKDKTVHLYPFSASQSVILSLSVC